MEASRSKLVKILPSMTDFAFLMPIVFLFARMDGLVTLLGDCDTGWHIRTGQWILQHGAVPAQDIFSFSKPGEPWFAWEWLSEIIFALIYRSGGLGLLSLFAIVLISVTFTMLFRIIRRQSNAVIAIVVTILAASASSLHWLARPHLFTLFFLVLFYAGLQRVREGRTKIAGIPVLAILPVGTILWTNLHGGFFVGVILVASYGIGEVLRMLLSADPAERALARLEAPKYGWSALACLAASLVNPYTYHLHVHVVQFLRDPYQPTIIMEFLSLSFHHPLAIFFEAMLLLGSLAAFWFAGKRKFTEPVILLMWAHGALLASRNIPLFMILAAPPVAIALKAWLEQIPEWNVADWVRRAAEKFNRVAEATTETDLIPRLHLVSLAGVAVVAALMFAPHPPKKFRPEFDPERFPEKAMNLLRQDKTARVFTFDQWGDYMIYSLYPHAKVFMDGRFDYYGADFEKSIRGVLSVNYGWEKTLNKYGVDTILMPPSAALTGALKESSRWKVIYDDGIALLFQQVNRDTGLQVSAASFGDGEGRDREVTKTDGSDQAITETKPKL